MPESSSSCLPDNFDYSSGDICSYCGNGCSTIESSDGVVCGHPDFDHATNPNDVMDCSTPNSCLEFDDA